MEPCSCYVLEFSVQPGGARWAELHCYSDSESIGRGAMQVSSEPEVAPYLLLWYGATFGIWSIQMGRVDAFLDLHPYVTAQMPGSTDWHALDSADLHASVQALGDQDMFEALNSAVLRVDWSTAQIQLPSLEGQLLMPGETTPVYSDGDWSDAYLPDEEEVSYGSYEVESGEWLESLRPEGEVLD